MEQLIEGCSGSDVFRWHAVDMSEKVSPVIWGDHDVEAFWPTVNSGEIKQGHKWYRLIQWCVVAVAYAPVAKVSGPEMRLKRV